MEKIKKIITNLLKQSAVKWIVLPFSLLFFWLVLSLTLSSYRSFTVLQYPHYQNNINRFINRRLFKGDKLLGDFYAKNDHLGIVAIRMGDIPKVGYNDEDILVFRIKEKKSPVWTYTNFYRSGRFTSGDYYTFGFNKANNSKGKEYIFELESTKGNIKSAIQITNSNPIYLTKYKFSKSDIFGNSNLLTSFLKEKMVTFLTNLDLLLSSFIFFLPLLFYVVWVLLPKSSTSWTSKKFQKQINTKTIQTLLIYAFILYDVTFYEYINVGLMLGLLTLWVGVSLINKQKSSATFKLSFILFFISLISIYFHLAISYDKASAFAYFLLIIGLIQSIIEYKKSIH